MKDLEIYEFNQSEKKQPGTYILCYEFHMKTMLSIWVTHNLSQSTSYVANVPFVSQKNKQNNFKMNANTR